MSHLIYFHSNKKLSLYYVLLGQIGSNLGENLDLLLRAVLSKLQKAETLSIIQVTVYTLACRDYLFASGRPVLC